MKTYVFGHIKPDLDSVVAAMSIAEYSKLSGVENPTPAIVEEVNQETAFVFGKFGLTSPALISVSEILPEDKAILVDHNEPDQRLVGLNPDQIIGIFDHHKVNVNFSSPIEICVMPYGSSNTLAWQLFKEKGFTVPTDLSKLMLSAILSDTVGLKSSTTTDKDRQAVADLAQISGIADIDGLTLEIFKAKSSIDSLTDEQVVLNDYKILDFGKKVLIGQTETVEQEMLLSSRKDGLLAAMQTIKQRESVDFIILCVTDILKINTKLLVGGQEEISLIEKAFGGQVTDNILDIGPKMSRKKDINPAIEKVIKQ